MNTHGRIRIDKTRVRRYVRQVLRGEQAQRGIIGVVFIDNRRCRQLNRRYLGHDFPTDVISFPLETGEKLEAEIYVNLDRARSQAREQGVSFMNEIARLVVHGMLHIAGYDDKQRGQAEKMQKRQEEYVNILAPTTKAQRTP